MVEHLGKDYGGDAFLVEARGYCISSGQGAIGLSDVLWSGAKESENPATWDLKKALISNKFIEVRDVSNGVVLIKWAGVSGSILKKKLPEVRFNDDMNRYAPAYIINKLWYSDTIRDDLRNGGVRYTGPGVGLFSLAPRTAQHLDGQVNNISVEDLLIKIASTFGGVVFYSECPRSGGIDFHVNYYYPKNWR
ncbi:hypothetical protein ACFPME_11630 [Rhodanobacter umsongensis]|uniref:Uncharacterized protein n=1 Tax=Rhodanobacter umsongensis TaxID=633153 RepID=A0ABW0JNC9_9GAMM